MMLSGKLQRKQPNQVPIFLGNWRITSTSPIQNILTTVLFMKQMLFIKKIMQESNKITQVGRCDMIKASYEMM